MYQRSEEEKMKVGVFAGTLVDTQMGVDLLKEKGIEALAFPMAQSPKEQHKLQYYSKDELENLFLQKAEVGKAMGMDKIFIYCNSLSSAIDYKKLEEKIGLNIITPLESYKNLDRSIKNLAIIAANGISAFKIDQIVYESREDIHTISIGNLSIVESIEEKKKPAEIIKTLNLDGLIKYFENIEDERYKIDAILLGCTHFPYLKNELKKISNLKIIDPADDMIARLE